MEASTWVLFSVVVSIAIPLACYTYSHWGDKRISETAEAADPNLTGEETMSKAGRLAAQIKAFWQIALFLTVMLNTTMAGVFLIVMPLMWVAGDAEVIPAVALITATVFNVWLLLTLTATYLHMLVLNRPKPNPPTAACGRE